MKSCPKDKRLEFWKYSYARESFIKVKDICKILLSEDKVDRTTLIALTISVSTFYARPFKQRKAVRLSEDIIPAEFLEVHKTMITIRDKSIAHKDVDAPDAHFGNINQLRVYYRNGALSVHTISPTIGEQMAKDLIKLSNKLIKKAEAKMSSFSKKYIHSSNLKNGDYILSLDDNIHDWLIEN